jgi:hypothetical protein
VFEDLFGWRDFGFGWLQDRSGGWGWPGREGLAEVAVAGVCGRDGQALPFGETLGERSVLGGQVLDPLAGVLDLVTGGEGEFVALGWDGARGFGGAQRRVLAARVTAAEFGVGGDGEVPWARVAASQSARSAMTAANTLSRSA